jgi:hypothetical protein
VVFPGDVALEVVADAAAEGSNDAPGLPNVNPAEVGAPEVAFMVELPKRSEYGCFGVESELLKLKNRFEVELDWRYRWV